MRFRHAHHESKTGCPVSGLGAGSRWVPSCWLFIGQLSSVYLAVSNWSLCLIVSFYYFFYLVFLHCGGGGGAGEKRCVSPSCSGLLICSHSH